MSWESICHYEDIANNTGVAALVKGHQIAIFNVNGELFAIDNYDPIGDANVLSRGIIGSIKGEVCVASPLYKQHFVLATGQCLEEPVSVKCYPIRNASGMIEIDTSALELQAA